MNNLYQSSKVLSRQEFFKLEMAFNQAWSDETTYPDIKDKWSEDNKAYGQCAITSIIVFDLFGGKIIYDKANFHLWNELPDGTEQDFSRKQFLDERVFTIYKYKTKDEILHDENGRRTNVDQRYQLLKERFDDVLKELK